MGTNKQPVPPMHCYGHRQTIKRLLAASAGCALLLGAVSAPTERALVQRQTEHVRAGEPIVNDRALRQERTRSLRAAVCGAVIALALRAVAARRARARPTLDWVHHLQRRS